jgi:hypothetical protein
MKSYIFDTIAFVRHPVERKVWFRVHVCAAHTACPECGSEAGAPCVGKHGYMVATHYDRRQQYKTDFALHRG